MRILLVDDHPMTAEGYQYAINGIHWKSKPRFTIAYNCSTAIKAMQKNIFNLAIIDYGLPGDNGYSIENGADLGVFIRKQMPGCRIIIITAHTEIIIIYDIYKRLKPDALAIKSDITPANLSGIVTRVLEGGQYQSPMVKQCMEEIWKKEQMIEDNNRQILFYMSKGYRIKELEPLVSLSSSAIQKRVLLMKKIFNVNDEGSLVLEAKKQGFI